jgi:hypothetical protein
MKMKAVAHFFGVDVGGFCFPGDVLDRNCLTLNPLANGVFVKLNVTRRF